MADEPTSARSTRSRDWHARPHQLRRRARRGDGRRRAGNPPRLDWLDEQLALWQQAVRDCEEEVVQAKAELSQRKFQTGTAASPTAPCRRRPCGGRRRDSNTPRSRSRRVRQWIGRLPKVIDEVYHRPGPAAGELPRSRPAEGAGRTRPPDRGAGELRRAAARLRPGDGAVGGDRRALQPTVSDRGARPADARLRAPTVPDGGAAKP